MRLAPAIYSSMLVYRQFPDDLFVASDSVKAALREMIQNPPADRRP